MRRRATLLAVWVVGTVASMALAWTAVQIVGGEVTEDPANELTAPAAAAVDQTASSTTSPLTAPPSTETTTTTGPAPTAPTTTIAPPPTAAPTRTQVFGTQGGSASVRCTGDAGSLEWATPAPGYEAEIRDGGPQRVEVRFESEDHESRLAVTCSGGAPSAQAREDGGGNSGPG